MDDEGIDVTVYEGVYPPAEDSYLLMDAIEIDESDSVLEIGCGCGFITTAITKIAKNVVATDISRLALENAKQNLKANTARGNWSLLQANLLSPLRQTPEFSVILFNPPYLPKEDDGTNLDHAFIGGEEGIEITAEFLKQAIKRLSSDGLIYTIASSVANLDTLFRSIKALGLKCKIIKRKRMFFEEVLVLKIRRR